MLFIVESCAISAKFRASIPRSGTKLLSFLYVFLFYF